MYRVFAPRRPNIGNLVQEEEEHLQNSGGIGVGCCFQQKTCNISETGQDRTNSVRTDPEKSWKVLKLKCWDFQACKVLEKGMSWKTLEKSWNSKVVVLKILFSGSSITRSLQKKFIVIHCVHFVTTCIAFGLVYCNAVTSKIDLVCALFDLMQPCLWTACILESPWICVFTRDSII